MNGWDLLCVYRPPDVNHSMHLVFRVFGGRHCRPFLFSSSSSSSSSSPFLGFWEHGGDNGGGATLDRSSPSPSPMSISSARSFLLFLLLVVYASSCKKFGFLSPIFNLHLFFFVLINYPLGFDRALCYDLDDIRS